MHGFQMKFVEFLSIGICGNWERYNLTLLELDNSDSIQEHFLTNIKFIRRKTYIRRLYMKIFFVKQNYDACIYISGILLKCLQIDFVLIINYAL